VEFAFELFIRTDQLLYVSIVDRLNFFNAHVLRDLPSIVAEQPLSDTCFPRFSLFSLKCILHMMWMAMVVFNVIESSYLLSGALKAEFGRGS
jgi:hypothetical protein